jgi:hypothetical protein
LAADIERQRRNAEAAAARLAGRAAPSTKPRRAGRVAPA